MKKLKHEAELVKAALAAGMKYGEERSKVTLHVGCDDYSLQVENLPKAPPSPQGTLTLAFSQREKEQIAEDEGTQAKGRGVKAAQGGLFEGGDA